MSRPPPGLRRPSPPKLAEAALLDAAFEVFATRGYRATRLEEVAEAVGVTKGAIYYYFDGKEDLLRRAVEHRHRAIFEEIAAALERERAPVSTRIRLVLRRVWQHWMEPGWGQAFRLVVGELSVEFPELFRLWAEEGPAHGWALVRDLIEEGVRNGEFRSDVDAEVAGRLIVSGLMLQAALQVHLGLEPLTTLDPDRIFDSAVDVFLHGLAVTHGLPARSRELRRRNAGAHAPGPKQDAATATQARRDRPPPVYPAEGGSE